MADPVGIVDIVFGAAVAIVKAAETARENKEECRELKKIVARLHAVLSQLKETGMMADDAIVREDLENLREALQRALELVGACQRKNALYRFFRAGRLSRRLRKVHDDISRMMLQTMWVRAFTPLYIPPKHQQYSPHLELFISIYPPPPPTPAEEATTVPVQKRDYTEPPQVLSPRPSAYSLAALRPATFVFALFFLFLRLIKFAAVKLLPSFREEKRASVEVPVQKCDRIEVGYALLPRPSTYGGYPSRRPARKSFVDESSLDQRAEEFIRRRKQAFIGVSGGGSGGAGGAQAPPIAVFSMKPPLSPSYKFEEEEEEEEGLEEEEAEAAPAVIAGSATVGVDGHGYAYGEVPAAGSKLPSPRLPGLTKFSSSELEAATEGFSVGNIIGRGGSSTTVFKGVLHDGGLVVAIKKFENPPKSLVAQICDELHIASELQRETKVENNNVIRIFGYGQEAIQKDNKNHIFLVEEYMANGNMGDIIFGKYFAGSRHDWHTRFRIIQGIAHGVNYLHEQNILHLDLKPSNVLLDSDMNPKITGLGRARKLNDETVARDDSIAGTVGYMPPEYILEGALSTKYDVYSFGILLLETINGMCSGSEAARGQASVEWAWEARDEGGGMCELLDASLCAGEGQVAAEVHRCMEIGLLCAQEKPADRPGMPDVLGMLNGEKALATPIRPEYSTKRRDRAARRAGAFSFFQGIGG